MTYWHNNGNRVFVLCHFFLFFTVFFLFFSYKFNRITCPVAATPPGRFFVGHTWCWIKIEPTASLILHLTPRSIRCFFSQKQLQQYILYPVSYAEIYIVQSRWSLTMNRNPNRSFQSDQPITPSLLLLANNSMHLNDPDETSNARCKTKHRMG